MIKNWLSFNESYDQSLINFNRDECRAFSTYLKQDVMSYFSIVNKQDIDELVQKFLNIFNEEFDQSISLSETQTELLIIGPLVGEPKHDYRSLSEVYGGLENVNHDLVWELLKYKNFKPGFGVKFKFPNDEELNQERYVKYYNKVLSELNDIPNTTIGCEMREPTNSRTSYLPFYIFLRFEDFKFNDPFNKENAIQFIEANPQHVNTMYKWANKDEIFDFLIDNPEIQNLINKYRDKKQRLKELKLKLEIL